MKITIDNIAVQPGHESKISEILSQRYQLDPDTEFDIIKKSLDARNKKQLFYRYKIAVIVPDQTGKKLLSQKGIELYKQTVFTPLSCRLQNKKISIIGTGPSALFAALRLLGTGVQINIFERGKPVDERIKDIHILEKQGVLNEESNILFGEGGAGTYSDGKLTTRVNKPEINWILETFVHYGGQKEIVYDSKPHIGTDRLIVILKNIRKHLKDNGVQFHFNEKVNDFITNGDSVLGIRTNTTAPAPKKTGNESAEYISDAVICAAGHSARELYILMSRHSIALEAKNFAMGVRVEHPAELINTIQYGPDALRKFNLPAADYRVTCNNQSTGRGIYSFCMCPGGVIVNSSSEQKMLCVNGMSYSTRSSMYSNAALIVTVSTRDFMDMPLKGIELQQNIERKAFSAGGGYFTAPAQRLTSFLNNTFDNTLPASSYQPGIIPANIRDYLPEWIINELITGIRHFDKKLKGFLTNEALIIGAETRSSSPVRIVRDNTMQSVSHKKLFPAGEGAGYAGGIMSCALDGIRVANSVAEVLGDSN